MKNMKSMEKSTVDRMVTKVMGENSTEQMFDKEKAYQYFLQLSNTMNFWGEGFHDNEEWSF